MEDRRFHRSLVRMLDTLEGGLTPRTAFSMTLTLTYGMAFSFQVVVTLPVDESPLSATV